jgi:hypothetical protein
MYIRGLSERLDVQMVVRIYFLYTYTYLLGPGAFLNGWVKLVVPSFTNLLARPVCVCVCVCVCE